MWPLEVVVTSGGGSKLVGYDSADGDKGQGFNCISKEGQKTSRDNWLSLAMECPLC